MWTEKTVLRKTFSCNLQKKILLKKFIEIYFLYFG